MELKSYVRIFLFISYKIYSLCILRFPLIAWQN